MDKLRALQYFVAAAEEGSLSAAGRRLGVTVPAVQKLVNSLEASLGVRLFERNAQGLQLTAGGEQYLEACRPLLLELEAVDEVVTRSERRMAGTLVVGTHAQIAQHLLLPALPHWHARHPDLQVDLRIVGRASDPEAAAVEVFVVLGWPEADNLVHKQLGQPRSFIAAFSAVLKSSPAAKPCASSVRKSRLPSGFRVFGGQLTSPGSRSGGIAMS